MGWQFRWSAGVGAQRDPTPADHRSATSGRGLWGMGLWGIPQFGRGCSMQPRPKRMHDADTREDTRRRHTKQTYGRRVPPLGGKGVRGNRAMGGSPCSGFSASMAESRKNQGAQLLIMLSLPAIGLFLIGAPNSRTRKSPYQEKPDVKTVRNIITCCAPLRPCRPRWAARA